MDSLVFGESQILGQFKKAYELGIQNKTCGPKFSKLLNMIIQQSKLIRTKTGLNALNTSSSAVAAEYIRRHQTCDAPILLVGASETNRLLAQCLLKKNFKNLYITNRTASNAKDLGKALKIQVLSWKKFKSADLKHFSTLCFATSAKEPLLTPDILCATQPRLVIDLSVPSNADKKLVLAYKSDYFDIADTQKQMNLKLSQVTSLKKQVQTQIEKSQKHILNQIQTLDLGRLIAKNILNAQKIHDLHFEEHLPNEFSNLDPVQRKALKKWTTSLLNKIHHIHIQTLKDYATKSPRRNS
jgi:glutamyl-tRNA reductase